MTNMLRGMLNSQTHILHMSWHTIPLWIWVTVPFPNKNKYDDVKFSSEIRRFHTTCPSFQ